MGRAASGCSSLATPCSGCTSGRWSSASSTPCASTGRTSPTTAGPSAGGGIAFGIYGAVWLVFLRCRQPVHARVAEAARRRLRLGVLRRHRRAGAHRQRCRAQPVRQGVRADLGDGLGGRVHGADHRGGRQGPRVRRPARPRAPADPQRLRRLRRRRLHRPRLPDLGERPLRVPGRATATSARTSRLGHPGHRRPQPRRHRVARPVLGRLLHRALLGPRLGSGASPGRRRPRADRHRHGLPLRVGRHWPRSATRSSGRFGAVVAMPLFLLVEVAIVLWVARLASATERTWMHDLLAPEVGSGILHRRGGRRASPAPVATSAGT